MSNQDGGDPPVVDFDFVGLTSADANEPGPGRETSSPVPGPSKTPIRSVPKGSGLAFFIEEDNSESETER